MDADPTPVAQLQATIELPALLAGLFGSLQTTSKYVAFALQSGDEREIGELKLPDAFSQIQLPAVPSQSEFRTDYRRWIIGNGFRDGVEALSSFLEMTRTVANLYLLSEKHLITGAEYNDATIIIPRRFHRFGLPEKLTFLETEYGLRSEALDSILGINIARNCLVHRNGIVSDRDANTDTGLTITWPKLELVVRDESGERTVQANEFVEAGDEIGLRTVQYSRSFGLGEAIAFSPQEFSDVCMALFFCGQDLVQQVEQFGRSHGVTFRDDQSVKT